MHLPCSYPLMGERAWVLDCEGVGLLQRLAFLLLSLELLPTLKKRHFLTLIFFS